MRRQKISIEIISPILEENMKFFDNTSLAEIIEPIPIRQRGVIGNSLASLKGLRKCIKQLMRKRKYNVVHSHSGTYPYALAALAANRKKCVRLHSLYCPLGARGGLFGSLWEQPFMARSILNKLDTVIAVSSNVSKSIEAVGIDSEKIARIPICVDKQRFFPRKSNGPTRFFPAEAQGSRILFVGNASAQKGLFALLEALHILNNKKVPFFFVGTIENENKIQEYITRYSAAGKLIHELGLDKHVRLLGLVDCIEDLYAESDIVVTPWHTSHGPSDYPLSALEGMAMGKCIVSTPVGGCPDLLQNNKYGILADGFSPASISAALERAITRPSLQKNVSRAALEKSNEFSLEKTATHLINIYRSLLERRSNSIGE
jgi:glycosyltransferase involved in cell wall biosynthesis